MGKAVNQLLSKNEEDNTNGNKIVTLTILDFTQETGSREKVVVIPKKQTQHERVVVAVREVKYLYDDFIKQDNEIRKVVKQTQGFEIVKEILMPKSEADILNEPGSNNFVVKVVGSVTRDLRNKDVQYDDYGW